ncbi:class I SAM-dependent methyltransferase [Terriglobus albidus]|uniref:class I SAM-dependent methyltransferase n=1 Tax=Terriglobus albidus TaxID=1592106 RepID=UPI0021E09097|nr:class I SAM-dependent methyltransferase [Terriglobus albidus]
MIAEHPAGRAFDTMADTYDDDFTQSDVGQAQRSAVMKDAFRIFPGRRRLLELNCGTGEDALRFAENGWRVLALDASERMIACARVRRENLGARDNPQFRQVATEDLREIAGEFDGVFSNFSGLNCVRDLAPVARMLAEKTTPGSPLLLCMSTRVCLWETAWYLLHAKPAKAFRRWTGRHQAMLQGMPVDVYYPTLNTLKQAFRPHFRLRGVRAIGLFVPPSYVESWIQKRPLLLRIFVRLDAMFSRLPLLRKLGDHMLLHFEKTGEAV